MKKESPNEIWLLLFTRKAPKEIIRMGYSRVTVHKYSAKFPLVLERYNKALQRGEVV